MWQKGIVLMVGLLLAFASVAESQTIELYELAVLSVEVSTNNGASWITVGNTASTYNVKSVAQGSSMGTFPSSQPTLPANTTVNQVRVTFRCVVNLKGNTSIYTAPGVNQFTTTGPAVTGSYIYPHASTSGNCSNSSNTFSVTAGASLTTSSRGGLAMNITVNNLFLGGSSPGGFQLTVPTLSVSAP